MEKYVLFVFVCIRSDNLSIGVERKSELYNARRNIVVYVEFFYQWPLNDD